MSRFYLRSPVLLAALLGFVPPLALAGDARDSLVVPDPAAAPGASEIPNMPPGASKAQRNHEVLSPTNPPDMWATGEAERNQTQPSPDTRSAIDREQVQRVFGRDAELLDLASASRQQLLQLQRQLQQRGLYSGSIDGQLGPKTRAAISRLLNQQHALHQRLLARGRITGQVAASLGAAADAPSSPDGTARAAGQLGTPAAGAPAPEPPTPQNAPASER